MFLIEENTSGMPPALVATLLVLFGTPVLGFVVAKYWEKRYSPEQMSFAHNPIAGVAVMFTGWVFAVPLLAAAYGALTRVPMRKQSRAGEHRL